MSQNRIAIFDDLDRYLPALLYDTGRFTTVQELLQYIRQQARYHMNRFDRAQTDFQRNRRHAPRRQPVQQENQNVAANDMFQQLFGTLLGTGQTIELHTMPLDLDAVPVRPTARQLEDGSELDTPISPFIIAEAEACTVCQEALEPGSLRRLRHCGHAFHRSCIDTWFLRHVQCPICRHDIRET